MHVYLIEGEDIGLVTSTIAFVTFNVDGDVLNGSETRNCEFSFIGVVEHNQSLFASLAVFQLEI